MCFHTIWCRSKSERLKKVSAVIEATPVLPDADTVKSFLATQQRNSGIIDILYNFVQLMALHYDHKWYIYKAVHLILTSMCIYILSGLELYCPMSRLFSIFMTYYMCILAIPLPFGEFTIKLL